MTTFTPKKLAFLQLASSRGDVCDSGSSIYEVHNIFLHNTNTASETVVLYLHDGTNEYILYKIALIANETVMLCLGSEGLIIDADSKLTGYTTTAAKVTCLVCGTERAS
jgi:hypothetical protein